ncbi:MAG: hypothetical protein EBR92_09435, partial [Alphaproteobacteria bacterium]|nr:hypothetical protein [Alphaproteobacteria bacterium]
ESSDINFESELFSVDSEGDIAIKGSYFDIFGPHASASGFYRNGNNLTVRSAGVFTANFSTSGFIANNYIGIGTSVYSPLVRLYTDGSGVLKVTDSSLDTANLIAASVQSDANTGLIVKNTQSNNQIYFDDIDNDYLIDAQVDGTSKFKINNLGQIRWEFGGGGG